MGSDASGAGPQVRKKRGYAALRNASKTRPTHSFPELGRIYVSPCVSVD